jgi:large subunit ribosomal protein L4
MTDTKIKKTTKVIEKKKEVKVVKPVKKAVAVVAPKKAEIKVKKTIMKKEIAKNVVVKADVFDVAGVSKGSMDLPSDVFGVKPNKNLIAQAIRVYLANQRQGTSSTKTRGEVVGSTRKIYRQKGTGRARHGAIKAPIFVGGGIVFGPHPRDLSLKFPQKMKKAALFSALSEKAKSGSIKIIDGDFSGKTKEVARLLKTMNLTDKKGKTKRTLFVIGSDATGRRGARNVSGLDIETAATISTYGVVINRNIIFIKSAVDEIAKRYINNK